MSFWWLSAANEHLLCLALHMETCQEALLTAIYHLRLEEANETCLKAIFKILLLSLALKLEGLACPVAQKTCPYSVLGLGQILNSDSSPLASLRSRRQHVNCMIVDIDNTR